MAFSPSLTCWRAEAHEAALLGGVGGCLRGRDEPATEGRGLLRGRLGRHEALDRRSSSSTCSPGLAAGAAGTR